MIAAGPADLALRSILSEIALTNEVSNGETALTSASDEIRAANLSKMSIIPRSCSHPKGLTCSHELGSCAARSGRTGDITNGAH